MDIKRKFMCVAVCVAMKSFIVRSQKSAGTRVGVSARMYNDSNSLEDRVKEGRGSERRHAGTGEGISARVHVANSHGAWRQGRGGSHTRSQARCKLVCVLLCFINPMLGNRYGPGVSSCQQTSDNLGWPDLHPSPLLRRWLYWSFRLPLRTDPQLPR